MADRAATKTQTQTPEDRRLLARVDAFFATIATGFNAYTERMARLPELKRLDAKSDAELARMGLTRDTIPQHVFRDLYHV